MVPDLLEEHRGDREDDHPAHAEQPVAGIKRQQCQDRVEPHLLADEPRLVGKQVGLNPVLTLLALYTGYRLLGVGGMIVFPITAMLLKQIWDHSGLQPEG